MSVYFDNAATTCVREEVAKVMVKVMTENYGNPSSTHYMGRNAKAVLELARKQVAHAIYSEPECVHFTSGGTESDNWAVFGACEKMWRQGKHIVISAYEHDAVNVPVKKLEEQGWEVTRVKPDGQGRITPEAVAEAVREDTAFVSVMLVNNETGVINPIPEISKAVRAKSGAVIHTDAVQAMCKMNICGRELGVDLMSLSSHKIHGPKGCGALYIKSGFKLPPRMLGGGQEEGLRSGTESIAAIAGFGEAARIGKEELKYTNEYICELRNYMIGKLTEEIPSTVIISPEDSSPYILSISLPGYKSEVLMNYMDRVGICVAKSSACKKGKRSHVLVAIGLEPRVIDGAIRISFSEFNTKAECDFFVENLKAASKSVLKVW